MLAASLRAQRILCSSLLRGRKDPFNKGKQLLESLARAYSRPKELITKSFRIASMAMKDDERVSVPRHSLDQKRLSFRSRSFPCPSRYTVIARRVHR